ncbi:MAG: hypothetical protein PWP76_543 [Candidatus Diapherotrites archaeon]|nr:hypothetical protein [Candidatus Diapherotrites archaeon]MDN5367043.1 hypothetical protein [Candidatus Diapherotrites archaeon]
MADISYVKGRLEGLFELVTLLKDMAHGNVEGSGELLQKMVDHIYVELGEILDVLGSDVTTTSNNAPPVIVKGSEREREGKTGVKAKDVLSELLTKTEDQGD